MLWLMLMLEGLTLLFLPGNGNWHLLLVTRLSLKNSGVLLANILLGICCLAAFGKGLG